MLFHCDTFSVAYSTIQGKVKNVFLMYFVSGSWEHEHERRQPDIHRLPHEHQQRGVHLISSSLAAEQNKLARLSLEGFFRLV
jgi:hypothetical protein